MARDPLDATIIVMLDQARAIHSQLRATEPARTALRATGDDPDAMMQAVQAATEAAEAAWAKRVYADGTVAFARKQAQGLVVTMRAWLDDLSHALKRGKRSKDSGLLLAVAKVRSKFPEERRRFAGAYGALGPLLDTLGLHATTLSELPLVGAVTASGVALLDRMKEAADAIEVAEVALRPLVAAEAANRLALLAALRGVRSDWETAQSFADYPVPDLDLRLCQAAMAVRRYNRKRASADDAVETPAPEVLEGDVPPTSDAVLVDAPADGAAAVTVVVAVKVDAPCGGDDEPEPVG